MNLHSVPLALIGIVSFSNLVPFPVLPAAAGDTGDVAVAAGAGALLGVALGTLMSSPQESTVALVAEDPNRLALGTTAEAYQLRAATKHIGDGPFKKAMAISAITVPSAVLACVGSILLSRLFNTLQMTTAILAPTAAILISLGTIIGTFSHATKKGLRAQFSFIKGFIAGYKSKPMVLPLGDVSHIPPAKLLASFKEYLRQNQLMIAEALRALGRRETLPDLLEGNPAPRTPLMIRFEQAFGILNVPSFISVASLQKMFAQIVANTNSRDQHSLHQATAFGVALASAMTIIGPVETSIDQIQSEMQERTHLKLETVERPKLVLETVE